MKKALNTCVLTLTIFTSLSVSASCLSSYEKIQQDSEVNWERVSTQLLVSGGVDLIAMLFSGGLPIFAPVGSLGVSASYSKELYYSSIVKTKEIIEEAYRGTMSTDSERVYDLIRNKTGNTDIFDSEIAEKIVELDQKKAFCPGGEVQDLENFVVNVAGSLKI